MTRICIWIGILTMCLNIRPALAQEKPPIVVFLADDLGYDELSVYGTTPVQTPNLERLAKQGMVFDNAFVASPSCAPSRAALLTGLMPARNGAEANHTYPRPEVTVLTQNLQKAGYEVAAFGKVAHDKMNTTAGFDHYNPERKNLAANVQAFFQTRKSTRPICILVGDTRPHVSWIAQSTYDPATVTLPPYLIDTPETRAHRARYYTDITGMDAEMGKLLDQSKELFGDEFLFLFSSDHGAQWPFGKWNLYDDGIRTPLLVSWPGKIAPNSRTQAQVSWIDILPTLLDITGASVPDKLDGKSFAKVLTGQASTHRDVIYTTHSGDGKVNVYPIRSVRTAQYKYIRNLHPEYQHTNHSDLHRKEGAGAYWDSWEAKAKIDAAAARIIRKYHIRPAEELYDLTNDPQEQTNLATNPKYAAQLRKMRTQLDAWMKEQGDKQTVFQTPFLAKDPLPDLKDTAPQKGH